MVANEFVASLDIKSVPLDQDTYLDYCCTHSIHYFPRQRTALVKPPMSNKVLQLKRLLEFLKQNRFEKSAMQHACM